MISRVLSTKDSNVAKRMYRRTSFYYVGRFLLPGLWGAAAPFVYFQRARRPAGGPQLPHRHARATSSTLLPVFGLLELVIAAMIAAEMSTVSGYMLTWETVIYNDLIMPCLKNPLPPKKQLFLTRLILVAIAVFLLFYGLWYRLPGNAWDYLAVTGNIYLGSVFTLLVARCCTGPGPIPPGPMPLSSSGAIAPITFLVVNGTV